MSVNVLPDMDEPRLKALGKQLNRNRKASLISTGKTKEKLDVYVKSLNKAQRALDGKYKKRSSRLKHSLAQVRGTQKVLRSRREQSFWEDSDEYPYGVYQGDKLDSYRREIDNVIESKHPKYRRQKKVEYNLNIGKVRGKLLDEEEAKDQFNFIMSKDRKTDFISREHTLTRPYFSKAIPDKIADYYKRLNDPRAVLAREYDSESSCPSEPLSKRSTIISSTRVEKLKKDEDSPATSRVCSPSDVKVGNMVAGNQSRLNLPPIAAKKDYILDKKSKHKSHQSSFLPQLTIRRATKGELFLGNNKDNTKFERLKPRRASTLI